MKVKTFILKKYNKNNGLVILKDKFIILKIKVKINRNAITTEKEVIKALERKLEERFKQIGINRKVIIKKENKNETIE